MGDDIVTTMACYVYIVEGKDGNFYTGITSNVRRRIEQHNGLSKLPGGRYTKSRRPVFLVHLEKFTTRREAHKRELEIKEFSHTQKRDLINQTTKAAILTAI
jgi:putative endonuclease